MTRVIFLVVIGLGGAAILLALGIWQMQRLAWKEDIIADIDARITAPAAALPEQPDPDAHAFLPVTATGMLDAQTLRVLVSQKELGAGFRLISMMDTDRGRILVDRGVMPVDAPAYPTPETPVTVTGNLQWPDEIDMFTPEPDGELWYARDVDAMADALVTRRVLLVAREVSFDGGPVVPLPVDTAAIPNNHLQYAITWFSLAAVWLLMSLLFARARAGRTPPRRPTQP